jgi:glycosyltransferase involved in cell wall biosynthesis
MHILSVIPTLARSYGGPTFAVVQLCEAGAGFGASQSLVTVASGESELLPDSGKVTTLRVPRSGLKGWTWSRESGFPARLGEHSRIVRPDIIHSHGIWAPVNHQAAAYARLTRVPLVISTHGMLSPWALRHKAWKKRIAWWLYQRRDLLAAAVLRATATSEAKDLLDLGLRRPVSVIANCINLPEASTLNCNAAAKDVDRARRRVVFLGRIYPVKALPHLVEAWANVRPRGWECVIAGPDEAGHRKEVEAEVRRRGLTSDFQFVGEVAGAAKWKLLGEADLLVLPSFTENFGMVVAEALACGVPVIASKGTPWEELIRHRCGWWVDINPSALSAALREATTMSVMERREMGERGRKFVRGKFSPAIVACEMQRLYDWVVGRGGRPENVIAV